MRKEFNFKNLWCIQSNIRSKLIIFKLIYNLNNYRSIVKFCNTFGAGSQDLAWGNPLHYFNCGCIYCANSPLMEMYSAVSTLLFLSTYQFNLLSWDMLLLIGQTRYTYPDLSIFIHWNLKTVCSYLLYTFNHT